MRIGSKFFIFNNSIQLIQRKYFCFLLAVMSTVVVILKIEPMFVNKSAFDALLIFLEEETLIVVLFLLFHILHFVIYYIDLKMHLQFIITKNGIIKKVDKNVYLLPWKYISISKTIIEDKYTLTNFWGKKIDEMQYAHDVDAEDDVIFCDKAFRFQKDYSIILNKSFVQDMHNKKISHIAEWQKNSENKNYDTHVEKISILKHDVLINAVNIVITLTYYIPIILACAVII